jgi:lipopolysaccharide export system permease protein
MKTVDRYILRNFLPTFIAGLLFFVLLVVLIDLFGNIVKYLTYSTPILTIAKLSLLYLPKGLSYALPISLLFSASYVFGSLYARNELTVIFASGVSLWRLARSLLLFGLAVSFISLVFEDMVVIRAGRERKALNQEALHVSVSLDESDVVVKRDGGRLVYAAEYYNDLDQSLNGVSIIKRDAAGHFIFLLSARRAKWSGVQWIFDSAVAYRWVNGVLLSEAYEETGEYREPPGTFQRNSVDVEDLRLKGAAAHIKDLESAGLPSFAARADYYKRYSFSVTPLIVIVLSIAMGGRFKKNVLLMSLLSSLVASVVFYVAQMITMMLAKLGLIWPSVGAWAPTVLFMVLGIVLVSRART